MKDKNGKVYLVGAGVGDVGYLTMRAHQLLAQAEVLVYDALVDSQLLQLVPNNCLQLHVGKRGGQPSTPQGEINRLLVAYCQQGKQVVRLKTGDPFIFGRSRAEIESLIAAGCAFEVIPGISAATAAPLWALIPLTDRDLSRCFAVVTGHNPAILDWHTLAQIDTLVILMGGSRLEEIVLHLQANGRSPSTPIAIIRSCGSPQQLLWTAQLENIVKLTAGESLSPAAIVIGEVVKLREYWLHQKTMHAPLTGKTILVTRSAGQSSQFRQLLQQEGARVIEMPALEIGPPSSWEELDNAILHLSDFSWLILTSANGVDYFFERLQVQGKDSRALAGVKIAVVGKKTAASLQQRGLQPDFIPPEFVADALVAHFPEKLKGTKVLFPRVESGGRQVLVQELTAKGAEVVEVPAYESRCPEKISPSALDALQRQAVDAIAFASSKTVKNFCKLIAAADGVYLDKVCIASIGPQTSQTCRQLLGRVDTEAREYTLEGLKEAIGQWAMGKVGQG
ncbi:MAG: uroporphyrinogen-III C-methyltransferase [Hormoscilla sp. GM102CHS1]|nr:uroporphyrinogen-III C-methyltransferase [Hormoscilla sp. GM102CHS1]